ncbi:MAG: hypothetical protein Q9202_006833 [Teloschistes flavicans]
MHLMKSTPLLLAGLAASVNLATATKLYVSSYTGTITTLNLTQTGNSSYDLVHLDTTRGCGDNATWLELDLKHRNLFCLDEGILTGNGSLTSFKINHDHKNDSLTPVTHITIPNAPVNSALLHGHNGTQLLAVAHYAWALTTYKVDPLTAALTPSQSFNFTQAKPGPRADRQAAPHPHQVLLDPTHRYLIVPDLGADLLRIFHFNKSSLQISERPSVPVTPGSGPRHGTFNVINMINNPPPPDNLGGTKSIIHYYLVSELASTLSSYALTYLPHNAGLNLTLLSSQPATGPSSPSNNTVFSGNAPAEVHLAFTHNPTHKNNEGFDRDAACSQQLIVSNRNATFYPDIANPDKTNATHIASDTLATFALPPLPALPALLTPNTTGDPAPPPAFQRLSPAGGSFPRQFSLNKAGDRVAVGLQNSARVVVFGRDVASGEVGGEAVADYEAVGQVTSVVWEEGEGCF